ncbi:MAG: MFS transporter [Bacillota bacterium]
MSKDNNYRIPLFGIVTGIYWFTLYTYIPNFSPYLESLGISYKMIGVILGSYGFTQMILRIPLGILSDRINKRKIFVIMGVLLGTLSSLGLWIFSNPFVVLLFRSLAGAAAACWVSYTVLFSSYFTRDETPKSIGLINSISKIGQVLAMLLGGLAAQYFSPAAPFLLAVIGGIIGLGLSSSIVEKNNVNKEPLKTRELFQVAKNINLMSVSFLAIIIQLITFATIFGFVPLAGKNIGASEFQLSMLVTLANVLTIVAAASSGAFFGKRFGENNSIIMGFIIIALSTVVVPYINTVNILILSQMIGGFGIGIVFSLLMGLSIKNIEDNKRATAMGFFQAIYGIGMFLGPVVVGAISDWAGLNIGFWVSGLIGLMGAFLTYVLLKKNYVQKILNKGGKING